MSGVIAKIIGLRLVGTTKYITKQNTTKYLQSMCHVRNRCSYITKNLITPVGVQLETKLQYSIIPSKTITSSVLFDDSKIELFLEEDYLSLVNDNTRNLILSKELDENIEEPFPREPIPVKFDRFNGLLDNGKLILKTEDGDTTFTFHHTLSLEVKKTSTTLQDEIAAKEKEPPKISTSDIVILDKQFYYRIIVEEKKPPKIQQAKISKYNVFVPAFKLSLNTSKSFLQIHYQNLETHFKYIIGSFSFSVDETVKIQADDSDEVCHLKHNVKIECDKKVDENLQNIIANEEVSLLDMIPGGTHSIFDCGTVVFKTQDGEKVVVRKKFGLVIFEDGQKTAYIDGVPQLTLDYV